MSNFGENTHIMLQQENELDTPELGLAVMPHNFNVVLICPDATSRTYLLRALSAQRTAIAGDFTTYPSYAHLPAVIESDCDAYVVEIDTDQELGLEIVEAICARKPSATVMVYTSVQNTNRMASSMRVGAREFLSGTIENEVLKNALLRASARRSEQAVNKAVGKIFVFWGSKGGSGVTTLASSFSIGLRNETGAEVLLLDFNPQLGDVSVLLGLTPKFTIADALLNPKRLDQEFVNTLVTKHGSGISVIAAPEAYTTNTVVEARSVGKLMEVVRNQFPYVVVDAGPGLGAGAETVFEVANTIYLVTELSIPALRNTQRCISFLNGVGESKLELVINRFDPRGTEFDENQVAKALGVVPRWKVPNDYLAVRRASNTGTPVILDRSPIAGTLCAMARKACGKPPEQPKKKSWAIFG